MPLEQILRFIPEMLEVWTRWKSLYRHDEFLSCARAPHGRAQSQFVEDGLFRSGGLLSVPRTGCARLREINIACGLDSSPLLEGEIHMADDQSFANLHPFRFIARFAAPLAPLARHLPTRCLTTTLLHVLSWEIPKFLLRRFPHRQKFCASMRLCSPIRKFGNFSAKYLIIRRPLY